MFASQQSKWQILLGQVCGPVPAACLLLGLTVLAYLPALGAGYVFDDHVYLTQDKRMDSVEGLGRIWTEVGGRDYQHQYYPLTSTAFWVQRRMWGDNPFGYHFVNVLLHALNGCLLWRLLRSLGLRWAWVAGAIFALHPVNVQSVAWISELKNVLSTFFFLSSALLFMRYFGVSGSGGDRSTWRGKTYGLGLVLFVCALAAKTATCLLPAALGLLLYWKRDRVTGRDVKALAPLAVLGLAFVGLTVYLESHHGGARGEGFSQSFMERVLIAGRSVWFYGGKLLWPSELTFMYSRWEIDAGSWRQYLYPVSAVVVLVSLWVMRRRLGKGPFTAVAYFMLAVVPVSFVNVAFTRYSYVADHWQYWASMGLIALVVGGAGYVIRVGDRVGGVGLLEWMGRFRWPAMGGVGAVGAAVVVMAAISSVTWQRAGVYRSPQTLWRDTLLKNPDAWAAHNSLALALLAQGRILEAIGHYRQAIGIKPDFAAAHNNLGEALQFRQMLPDAIACYRHALRLQPDAVLAHSNLGSALMSQGRLEEAVTSYHRALELDPDSALAHNNLGTARKLQGRLDDAVRHHLAAIRVKPDFYAAHYNLANALRAQGRLEEAVSRYQEALAITPGSTMARNNFGTALLEQGKPREAQEQFRLLVEQEPGHAGGHYNLGIALSAQGRFEEAADHYRRALQIKPEFAHARSSLARLLQRARQPAQSIPWSE